MYSLVGVDGYVPLKGNIFILLYFLWLYGCATSHRPCLRQNSWYFLSATVCLGLYCLCASFILPLTRWSSVSLSFTHNLRTTVSYSLSSRTLISMGQNVRSCAAKSKPSVSFLRKPYPTQLHEFSWTKFSASLASSYLQSWILSALHCRIRV